MRERARDREKERERESVIKNHYERARGLLSSFSHKRTGVGKNRFKDRDARVRCTLSPRHAWPLRARVFMCVCVNTDT